MNGEEKAGALRSEEQLPGVSVSPVEPDRSARIGRWQDAVTLPGRGKARPHKGRRAPRGLSCATGAELWILRLGVWGAAVLRPFRESAGLLWTAARFFGVSSGRGGRESCWRRPWRLRRRRWRCRRRWSADGLGWPASRPAGSREPEAEEIHDGGREGVAGAVEGLQHDHAIGVADVAVADDAQARGGERHDGGVVGKEADDGRGEK